MKSTIQTIYAACGKEYPTNSDTLKAIDFISELIDENHFLDVPDKFSCDDEILYNELLQEHREENESNYSELFDAIEELESKLADIGGESDFYFEYDGDEYRIISESSIWEIYVEEIQRIVEDCYSDVLKLDDIPGFIEFSIDWEQTAKNAYVDGYGHTFSSYDGSELEIGDYYVFRTN